MRRKTSHLMPEKSWLEQQWYLPPRGLGRSDKEIGDELGVEKYTIQNWRKTLGVDENRYERIAFHQGNNGVLRRKPVPEKIWLEQQYLKQPNGLGRSVEDIANECRVERGTVRRWIEMYGIHESHSQRHSIRMSGKNNPSYRGGTSRNHHKRILAKVSRPICEWCGSNENVQVHHRDHDVTNGEINNLGWLCHHCNIIEAHIYGLLQKGRITATIEPRKRIVIKFNK